MGKPASRSDRDIRVAIDTSSTSNVALQTAALQTAARMADLFEAVLEGWFVEDSNLLRLASLPGTQELSPSSGMLRTLNPTEMERTLRSRAASMRLEVAKVAHRSQLEWSFRILQGPRTQMILSPEIEADLLVLSGDRWSFYTSGSERRGPILALVGADDHTRVIELAERLKTTPESPIVVLADIASRSRMQHINVSTPWYLQRCPEQLEGLLAVADRWRPSAVLMERSHTLITPEAIDRLRSRLACPVVLVR